MMRKRREEGGKPVPFDREIQMRVVAMGAQLFAPRIESGMQVVGVVQHGQETGALVRVSDGHYLQINGDVRQPLNTTQVELAMDLAGIALPFVGLQGEGSIEGPVVTYKRRKVLQKE